MDHLNLTDNTQADSLIAILMGIMMMIIAYKVDKNSKRLKLKGIPVEGVVFAIERQNDPDDDIKYYPVIRYATLKGEEITKRNQFYFNPSKYNVGDKVNVVYDPDNAINFMIDDGANRSIGKIFIVLGALILAGGLYFMFR